MKAIYLGRVWHVVNDDGEGLLLQAGDGTLAEASYSAADLVVDPTDADVAALAHGAGCFCQRYGKTGVPNPFGYCLVCGEPVAEGLPSAQLRATEP